MPGGPQLDGGGWAEITEMDLNGGQRAYLHLAGTRGTLRCKQWPCLAGLEDWNEGLSQNGSERHAMKRVCWCR